jgi:hypothetical protein
MLETAIISHEDLKHTHTRDTATRYIETYLADIQLHGTMLVSGNDAVSGGAADKSTH